MAETMDDMKKELEELSEIMETKKAEYSRLDGQRGEIQSQLRAKFNCQTLKAARQKSGEMQKSLDEIHEFITTEFRKLREKYDV